MGVKQTTQGLTGQLKIKQDKAELTEMRSRPNAFSKSL